MVDVVSSIADVRSHREALREKYGHVGLVPTMGSLHEGHLSLFDHARADGAGVIASIFVNPLQFNQQDDYVNYPRDLERDIALAESHGVSLVFSPSGEVMYPDGEPSVTVDSGVLGSILEGASRPGHFRGVATVVAKLLSIVAPDHAYFGEKDFQQLAIIRQLVSDLSFPVEIVGCPTVRDHDGCALSSRNARLDEKERKAAVVLYRSLRRGFALIEEGEESPRRVEEEMAKTVREEPLASLDYAVVRDERTLGEIDRCAGSMRLLIAASFGAVRLIDNLGIVA